MLHTALVFSVSLQLTVYPTEKVMAHDFHPAHAHTLSERQYEEKPSH